MKTNANVQDAMDLEKTITEELTAKLKSVLQDKEIDPIYGTEDLAKYLGVTGSWLYKHYSELPHFRLGGLIKFRKSDIDKHLQSLKRSQM